MEIDSKVQEYLKKSELRDVIKKVEQGERLGEGDALQCLNSGDISALGWMADFLRRKIHGDRVSYSTYLNINYTNVCNNKCQLCAFWKKSNSDDAYTLELTDIEDRVRAAISREQVKEIHIVGGLNSELPFSYYLDLVKMIRGLSADIFIKAFTAVEIDFFAEREKKTAREVLLQLKAAGLNGLPGGGAEILSDRVRQIICSSKIGTERWLEVQREAHRLGLVSNATMLYGHFETNEEIVEHLRLLRELQDETKGFNAFIPLAFHPKNTIFENELNETNSLRDLQIFTTSRIYLDNVPHLKAHWSSLGVKFSQVLLSYGVDDLGGTALGEKIFHDAGALTPESLNAEDLESLIREIGREPVLVDSGYAK